MTTFTLNRRTLLTGTVALGTVGLLAACGGNSSKTESNALSAGDDLSKAVSYNEKDRSALKNGGELRLSADGIGPNFNILNTNGYTAGNLNIQAAINSSFTGGYYADFRGEGHMNEDYVTEYKAQTVDGVQTVTFKINPKAVFNDGTPIDVNAVKSYQTIYTAAASGSDYQITPSPIWEQVASVESVDGDDRHVKITMSKPWYPIEGSFTSFLHPAFVDVSFFNDGMNGKPLDKYWAGPFKVGEWDASGKVLTVVRNDKWWGTKPLLERITWREMSSQAEQAAFKNNEIDYADASTLSSYNELSSVSNIDIRKGSALAVGNYEINPEKVPLPVRRAFVAALNREQLFKLRYEKLGWKEPLPGSMCMLPMQEGYQDNYPTKLGKDVATKILEDAGYTKNGDYYEKDGVKASYSVTTFGTDPVVSSTAQFLTQQMKEIGIELSIDNHGASEMASIISAKNFTIKSGGYGITTSPVDAANYFYISETNNGHGKELDSLAATMMSTEDPKEQLKIMNELEKRHLDEVAIYVPTHNGPNFKACRKTLANYGPMLFGLPYYNPNVWINVGWEK